MGQKLLLATKEKIRFGAGNPKQETWEACKWKINPTFWRILPDEPENNENVK